MAVTAYTKRMWRGLSSDSKPTADTVEGEEFYETDTNNVFVFVDSNWVAGHVVLTLAETTTPTAVANYGKVYTKNDNKFYFQDGAGTEHVVDIGASGIKHEFHMPFEDPTGVVGNWDIVEINAAQDTHFAFQVSEDFEALVSAKVVMIPDATETIQWDVSVSVAAAGEAYDDDDSRRLIKQ